MSDDGSDAIDGDLFKEPDSFRPRTPPPTTKPFVRRDNLGDLDIRLVGGHPLWGHVLYPASIALARFLEQHADALTKRDSKSGKGKAVLELGAAGGLPSVIAALEGAETVVATDFPDAELLQNLRINGDHNLPDDSKAGYIVEGYTWGSKPTDLLSRILDRGGDASTSRFDLILMSDLVFNHSQHEALLSSCEALLETSDTPSSGSTEAVTDDELASLPPQDLVTPLALCFYSHHRPHLASADLQFLHKARSRGWAVWTVFEDRNAGPAFPEDDGRLDREGKEWDRKVRGSVHGWAMRWNGGRPHAPDARLP